MPIVSIIIPNYNGALWLSTCLDSALAQDYASYTILVIDDCSIDNSVSIIENYKKNNPNIILIKNEVNRGVSFSRNIGIQQTNAKYVAFLDSDDTVAPDWLSSSLLQITARSLDVCGCWMTSFGKSWFRTTYTVSANYEDIVRELWFIGGSVGGLIVKKSLCIEHPFDTQKTLNEDKIFYDTLLSATKNIFNVQKRLYYYRRHGTNTTRTNTAQSITTYTSTNNLPEEYRHLSKYCITLGAPVTIYTLCISLYLGIITLTIRNYLLYLKLLCYYSFKKIVR